MASTYPLEVVEANYWLHSPGNAALNGDQLAAVLEQKSWDPSVKSLVPFAQIMRTLNDNIEWTEQLGDAFLTQQTDVMDQIQRLRQDAQNAGTLNSTLQQTVSTQGQNIVIVPVNPQVIYVPTYDPMRVYGDWIYTDYPPYVFSGYPYVGNVIGYTFGVAVVDTLRGWNRSDWRNHRITIDNDRFQRINRGVPSAQPNEWHHDPDHRHSVPYGASVQRVMLSGRPSGDVTTRSDFRGYEATPVHSSVQPPVHSMDRSTFHSSPLPQQERRTYERQIVSPPSAQPQMHEARPRNVQTPNVQPHEPQQREAPRQMPVIQQPAPVRPAPLFESFSPRGQVQQQTQRGISSRAAAAPPSGGNRGDHDDRRREGNR